MNSSVHSKRRVVLVSTLLMALYAAGAADAQAGGNAPANWQPGAGYAAYGLSVVVSSPREVGDQADIVFCTTVILNKLNGALQNNATKEVYGDARMLTEIERVDTRTWKIHVFFPESGEFSLSLTGQQYGAGQNTQIASVNYTASVPAAAVKPPSNCQLFPRFAYYGLSILSAPPEQAGGEAAFMISAPEGFILYAQLYNNTTHSSVPTIAVDAVGTRQTISMAFPKSGDCTIYLIGRPGAERTNRTLAMIRVNAAVSDGVSPLLMWRMEGRWNRFSVSGVEPLGTEWKPMGPYPVFNPQKTVLQEDLSLSTSMGTLMIPKGTQVTFAVFSSALVSALSYQLPKNMQVTVAGSTYIAKAGTEFSVGDQRFAFQNAADVKIMIGGGELLCPAQSRITVEKGVPVAVALSRTSTFTFDRKAYECTGDVVVENTGFINAAQFISMVRITAPKAAAFTIGGSSFVLPSQSIISFDASAKMIYYQFWGETTIKTKTEPVKVGLLYWVAFDAEGGILGMWPPVG